MSLIDLIKSLSFNFNLNKKTGARSTQSKIKARQTRGGIAGRDISRPYHIRAGGNISAGGDIVAGHKYESTSQIHQRHPFIEITLGTRISSQGTYVAHFLFRNAGDSAATLQSFSLAGESIPIDRKTLSPNDQAYEIQRDITGSKIRNNKINNPVAKVTYRSLTGAMYATKAKVIQGEMAVPTFNLEGIEDNEFEILAKDKK